MGWQLSSLVEEFASATRELLARSPAEHTMTLTMIENARGRTAPPGDQELFGWWTDPSGAVTGAATLTPPYELLLGPVPDEAMAALAEVLLAAQRRPPGVNGPAAAAAQLAAVWGRVTGERAVFRFAQRLYQLQGPVTRPPGRGDRGRATAATAAHTDLLAAWWQEFQKEAGVTAADPMRAVQDRLSYGGLFIWERTDGTPVAMAGRNRPAAGVVRLGPVYTPPEHREQGFGSAVTAAVSDVARQQAAPIVVLFADLANPVSNGIYQRLGFQPVTDRMVLGFEPTA